MYLPSASPNENRKIENSIRPMPASRAERSSADAEILASRDILTERLPLVLSSWPGIGPAIHVFRAAPLLKTWMPGTSPGMTSYLVCRRRRSAVRITTRRDIAMTDFDPHQHRMVPQQRWFEDFILG